MTAVLVEIANSVSGLLIILLFIHHLVGQSKRVCHFKSVPFIFSLTEIRVDRTRIVAVK